MDKMKLIFWWVFYVLVATLWFIKLGLIKIMRQQQPTFDQSKNKISSFMKKCCSLVH